MGSTGDLIIAKVVPAVNRTMDVELVASRFLTAAEAAEAGSLGTEIFRGPIVPFPSDI